MTYRKKAKKKPWGLWDIWLLQLLLLGALALGLVLGAEPLRQAVEQLYRGEPLTHEDLTPMKEGLESFLHQFIAEEDFTYPVSGVVTSFFGLRSHPISGAEDFHKGIDIAAPLGTAIHAAADGVVETAAFDPSYGNHLLIRHSEDFSTFYAHCQRLIAQEGTVVRRGDRIALLGSTGLSTGPHVHFECRLNGEAVDCIHGLDRVIVSGNQLPSCRGWGDFI